MEKENKEIALQSDDSQREKIRLMINSGIFPKRFLVDPIKKVPVKEVTEDMLNKACAIIEFGKSLNLTPYQSVNSIADINGKMTIYGDSLLSMVIASGLLADKRETFDEEKMVATCYVKRKGFESGEERSFSQQDAENAGLWAKGVWKQYPKRMLQMRARGFALRDVFPDILGGLISSEEAMDYNPFQNQSEIITEQDIDFITETKEKISKIVTKDELNQFYKDNIKSISKQNQKNFVELCKIRKQELSEAENNTIDIE